MVAPDFSDVRLGDIITLPDAQPRSVRMMAPLPANELTIGGIVLLGEMEVLLAPAERQVSILSPVEMPPPQVASAKRLCEGAAAYWAPHLPALAGAMGEVIYRVMVMRSSFAPVVSLARGVDTVFFFKSGEIHIDDLRVLRMPRTDSGTVDVARYAAIVDPAPVSPMQPRPTPQQVPQRVPQRVGAVNVHR